MLQLETLLSDLARGKTLVQITQENQVSPDLLDQMLLNLVHGGYLERLEMGCTSGSCKGCSAASSCKGIVGWHLTERGRAAVGAKANE